jgi:nucleotide-binding universal stress UspA family protein
MGERILVPVDGSPLSRRAFEFALDKHPGAEFLVLSVLDPIDAVYWSEGAGPSVASEWYERAKERTDDLFAELRTETDERGVSLVCETDVGKPARTILRFVDEYDVDHVVMGSHGRSGVSRVLLGSVTEEVMRHADVPVTVVR